MRRILIAGILVVVVLASIGLVTAGNGFSPGDETDESDNVCDVDGYGFGDDTCDGEELEIAKLIENNMENVMASATGNVMEN